jgi:hypothetical protein
VAADFPDLVESASSGVEEVETLLRDDPLGVGIDGPSDLFQAVRDGLGEVGEYVDQAVSAGAAAFRMLAGLLLLFVILFFYLKDGRKLVDGLLAAVPARHRARWNAAADVAWETLGQYFRGQLVVALADAVFIGIGLLLLGVPLAVPLAVLIFFGALFPLIGAVLTGALAVLVALADGGLVDGLLVLGLIVAVQQLEGNVLQPYIQSRAIQLHPLVVLLSVTAGSLVLGVLGAFIAVPAVAVVGRIIGSGTTPGVSGTTEPPVAAGGDNQQVTGASRSRWRRRGRPQSSINVRGRIRAPVEQRRGEAAVALREPLSFVEGHLTTREALEQRHVALHLTLCRHGAVERAAGVGGLNGRRTDETLECRRCALALRWGFCRLTTQAPLG